MKKEFWQLKRMVTGKEIAPTFTDVEVIYFRCRKCGKVKRF